MDLILPSQARILAHQEFSYSIPAADIGSYGRLPLEVRRDLDLTLRIMRQLADSENVKKACRLHAAVLQNRRGFTASSLARKFYSYVQAKGDWRALVDNRRAPEARQILYGADHGHVGLPLAFVEFWRKLCGENKRKYEPAHRSLLRIWRTGLNSRGEKTPVPGYGYWREWCQREHPGSAVPPEAPTPRGWSYHNLMRSEHRMSKAQEAASRIGIAAARAHTPYVLATRDGLRFLEEVQFDDVKVDFRVICPESGQVMDLWLLVAVDRATDVRLGYGMRPARVREDGTQEHLKLQDMKALCGFVLERWGIAPYPMRWKIEHGTATLADATAQAVHQLTSGAVTVSYSSMISGKSAAGYGERALGNSRAKAGLESGNNLLHNEAGDLPGQTGRRYDVRPADLASRESDARAAFAIAQQLDPALRGSVKYPILTIAQAREQLNRIFRQINTRTEHDLESFEEVWEFRTDPSAEWQPLATFPESAPEKYETRRRMESPFERMMRLTAGLEWRHIPPAIIVQFYESTQRQVAVNDQGEIQFQTGGRMLVFRAPEGMEPAPAGTKFLAYHHPAEPDFLHLTRPAPHCGYVATWSRRDRVRLNDEEGLKAAMQYTQHALKAQLGALRTRHQDEADALAQARAHNAQLLEQQRSTITVAQGFVPTIGGHTTAGRLTSPEGEALLAARAAIAETRSALEEKDKEQDSAMAALGRAAVDDVLASPTENQGADQDDLVDSIL